MPAGDAPELAEAGLVARSFAGENIEEILAALDQAAASGSAFAADAATAMRAKSPMSLKLTLAALHKARHLEFEEVMRMEYRISSRIIAGHDLYEGIRAQVIDKDRDPHWLPSDLAGVSEEAIAAYFADLGPAELVFHEGQP